MNRAECLVAFVTILRKDPTLVLGLMSPFPADRDSSVRDLAKHIAENTPPDSSAPPAPSPGEAKEA